MLRKLALLATPSVPRRLTRPWPRWLLLTALALTSGLAGAETHSNAAATLSATLSCPAVAAPGRVTCSLDVASRESLVWLDALFVTTPPFASPLRTRVVADELTSARVAAAVVLSLPLVARGSGEGELLVRARAVVCVRSSTQTCRAVTRTLSTRLVVRDSAS